MIVDIGDPFGIRAIKAEATAMVNAMKAAVGGQLLEQDRQQTAEADARPGVTDAVDIDDDLRAIRERGGRLVRHTTNDREQLT